MASLNRVFLIGNLTRDPEINYTSKGSAIADVGIAVNRNWTTESGEKREEVTFIDVTVFGRTAEVVGEYCKKGSSVMIEGRLQLDQWDDKATGHKRSKLKVVADKVEFLGGCEQGGERPASRPTQRTSGLPTRPPQRPPSVPDLDAPDDDIPF